MKFQKEIQEVSTSPALKEAPGTKEEVEFCQQLKKMHIFPMAQMMLSQRDETLMRSELEKEVLLFCPGYWGPKQVHTERGMF